MAQITPETPVKYIRGKLAKDETTVYSVRYGQNHAWKADPYLGPWSEAQLAVQDKFKTVTALVLADMADPTNKKEWQEKAKASGGRYRTARGCAFAHYWAAEEDPGL